MAIALPYKFANGQTDADLDKVQANFATLANKFGKITDGDIDSGALISPLKVGASIDGNINLRQDIQQLESQQSSLVGQQLGNYNSWNEMLPIIRDTPISATCTTSGKATIAAGGKIAMLGHNFVTKAVTSLGTDGKANGTPMDAESVYALRLTVGAPPTGESAHVQEGGIDTLAVHFELVKLTNSRYVLGTVTGATSTSVFTLSITDVQGARLHFLDGSGLVGYECDVAWATGGTVYMPQALPATPAGRVLINKDKRPVEASGSLGGPSSPSSALIAIVVSMASGTAPAVIYQPSLPGLFNYDRSLKAETDWSADLTNDGTEHTLAWTRPVDGARLKSLSGWVALADHSVPSRVALRPLFSASVLDGTLGWANGNYAEVIRYSGLEVRLLGDGIGVSSHFETWPSGDNPGDYSESRWYTRVRVKVIAEYMP
jgi:hypothetical protein